MNTHGLVLCQSANGWSLHAPGSTDEDIAQGNAPYILTGTGEPLQNDYDAAWYLWVGEGEIRHDMYGYYWCDIEEAEYEDEGNPSVGFDGRPHYSTIEEASTHRPKY